VALLRHPKKKKDISKETEKKSSWLGGIFGKILKPSNQIHLPDDSNKSIIYDEKLGRWINKDGDDDSLVPVGPPPMDPLFMGSNNKTSSHVPNGQPAISLSKVSSGAIEPGAPPVQSYRATKRKGRGYVDVFGKSGATKPVTTPPMLLSPLSSEGTVAGMLAPPLSSPMLCPQPSVDQVSNNNPSPVPVNNDVGEPNPSERLAQGSSQNELTPTMPMMFNPSSMTSVTAPPAF